MTWKVRPLHLAPVLGIATMAILYGLTLQTDINGRSTPALIDVGELQIALSSWGTTHATGYPLYTMLGNLLSELARAVGVAPAAATSALSCVASLMTFVMLCLFVWKATGQVAAALASVLLLSLSPTFWLNSVVTEVYGLNIFLVTMALYLAWRMEQGDRVSLLVMAGLMGLAMSHHVLNALMLPAFVVLLWRPARAWFATRRPARAAGLLVPVVALLLAFLSPFALYVYLPLRIIQKAPWIYENWRFGLSEPIKFTLSGFLAYETGREYTTKVSIPQTLAQAGARIMDLVGMWSRELGPICVVAGLLGLTLTLFGKQRRLGLALWLALLGYGVFTLFYQDLQDTSLSLVTASLIPVVIGAGLLVAWSGECLKRIVPRFAAAGTIAAWGMAAVLVAAPFSHLPAQYTDIRAMTKDPAGREVIAAAQRIPDPCPTILSLWGIDYFAYYYAQLSTHELPACAHILPLHGDVRQSWQRGERVFVASHFFYQTTADQLQQQFGRLYLHSAGYGNVELANQPATVPDEEISGLPTSMGGVITLLGHRLQRSADGATLNLSLYWRADGPQRQDYSVFVHVSDKAEITGPGDIVSQADSLHPVYGWYPTSLWSVGEVIRDDYAIAENPKRPARLIIVGLYQSQAGTFTNLGSVQIDVGAR